MGKNGQNAHMPDKPNTAVPDKPRRRWLGVWIWIWVSEAVLTFFALMACNVMRGMAAMIVKCAGG